MIRVFESSVVKNEEVAPSTFLVEMEGKVDFEPGQFVMISLQDEISVIPKPFSIFYSRDGVFSVLFKVFGGWTARFSKVKAGDKVRAVAPCGTGFLTAMKRHGISEPNNILFIAGGLGVASLYPVIDFFGKSKSSLIFGGRSSYDIILKDEISQKVKSLYITTQDGSEGKKGVVLDVLFDEVSPYDFDIALSCGPYGMLKALWDFWIKNKINTPLFFAMEERMGCGLGLCFSCVIKTQCGPKLCCTYGPVFSHTEIVF
jgi:dihydroorotate dehydrogenase electron transfer subunit